MYMSPFKILQKKIGLHEIPNPWGNLSPSCDLNFANNISKSDWTWHNLWTLLSINLKYKYFHISVDWLEFFIFKCICLHDCPKFSDLYKVFRLLENAFMKLPTLGMMWSLILHVKQPQKFLLHLPWKAFRKRFFYTFFGKTLCPYCTGKSCGSICSFNICKEVQITYWIWQKVLHDRIGHDLIINPPCRTAPQNFFPSAMKNF